jgi:4-diphosphocytidyl-2-C-methyl-D-erythritol kinase
VKVVAPAKLNLYLSVGARRPDGMHEIESVMQAVSLYDDLIVSPSASLTLRVSPPAAVPEDESNLVLRAARALGEATGAPRSGELELVKRIPVAAGLGGGSADAAAALVGLNDLWGTRISKKALARLGAGVGSDVPFCVYGGTAAVRGMGENVAPLPAATLWWVIAVPEGSLSTAAVYERFDALGGAASVEGDPWEVADALARGDAPRLGASLRNDLEPASASLLSFDGREALLSAGAVSAVLSGSGPAWCGLARDDEHAREVAERAASSFARVEVVRSLEHGARIVER